MEVLDTDEQMAFFYSNLALAEMGMRGYPAALAMFSKGLRSAILNHHRLHGPILTDLADLECRMGRYQAGLDRLVEARPIVTARYADDPWRTAHVDNVRAGCLTGFGRYPEATRLMASSLPIILKKWPPNTLFGHDALERAVRLYTHTGEADRVDAYRAQLQEK